MEPVSREIFVNTEILGYARDENSPKAIDSTKTGCVQLFSLLTECFYRSSSLNVSEDVVDSSVAHDGNANVGAVPKPAIEDNESYVSPTACQVACKVDEPDDIDGTEVSSLETLYPTPRSPDEMPTTITLDRVRACQNGRWFWNSVVTRPEYLVFGVEKMSRKHQKKLYISQVNVPPKGSTKNIVLAVAAQQNVWQKGGSSCGLTGQCAGYKLGFKKETGSLQNKIDPSGVVSDIMRTGYLSLADTFVGLVFDSRFHYLYRKETNNRHENGFYHFLLQRLGSEAGTIYLAGHSRGGCLVMRLASRLSCQFPNARIIVHNFDGVCIKSSPFQSGEFGLTKAPTRVNPLNEDWFVYTSNITERFHSTKNLSILSVLSGQHPQLRIPTFGLSRIVRSFGHSALATGSQVVENLKDESGRVWYEEVMTPFEHNAVHNTNHLRAVIHFQAAMESFA